MGEKDLELAQLLCTRLCHDLAGPVGAVAAGVELIGGDPTQVDAETLGLIGNSSAAAAMKLKFMRAALGGGAAAQNPQALLDGYLESVAGPSGKAAVTWPPPQAMAAGQVALGGSWTQLLLNLCLLALETQPACRALSLGIIDGSDLIVTLESRGAAERPAVLRPELAAAIAGTGEAVLSAKTIHGNLTGRLVRAAKGRLDVKAEGSVIIVTAAFSKGAA
jgi:histidine phosphotransferase ChpT